MMRNASAKFSMMTGPITGFRVGAKWQGQLL
jgi:hypothetical protein